MWIYLPGRGRNNSKSILVRIAAVVIFGAIAIYYVMQNMMDSQMFYRFQSLLSGGDGSLHKRLNMYVEGFKTFLSNPIFGYGFGGYQDIYGGYSHATVVEIPVSGGVIGTLLYITFFVQMIIGAKRSIKLKSLTNSDFSEDTMNLILCIIMVALCVCVIHSYLFNSYIAFAIIVSINIISKKEIEYKG